jgi:hypothetical protein
MALTSLHGRKHSQNRAAPSSRGWYVQVALPVRGHGEQTVKNIARPVRAYAMDAAARGKANPITPLIRSGASMKVLTERRTSAALRLSIFVLPFAKLSNEGSKNISSTVSPTI